MMKFNTRVKKMIEKQIFVLSEQIRKMKQTTPIKMRKNPELIASATNFNFVSMKMLTKAYQSQH